jgi:hypothetical protein
MIKLIDMGKVWNSTINRYTPLPKPSKPIARSRSPIAKRSAKKIQDDAIYFPKAAKFKKKYPFCHAQLEGCTFYTTDVHHARGRGIYYLVEKYWVAVCRSCHNKIGEQSEMAYKKKLSLKRLHKL